MFARTSGRGTTLPLRVLKALTIWVVASLPSLSCSETCSSQVFTFAIFAVLASVGAPAEVIWLNVSAMEDAEDELLIRDTPLSNVSPAASHEAVPGAPSTYPEVISGGNAAHASALIFFLSYVVGFMLRCW